MLPILTIFYIPLEMRYESVWHGARTKPLVVIILCVPKMYSLKMETAPTRNSVHHGDFYHRW